MSRSNTPRAPFTDDDVARLRTVFGRVSRALNREVDTAGMTRSQLSILATVVKSGPIGLSELAEVEGINPTMLSRIVGKLAEADLIRRVTDPRDRRSVSVEVTPHGAQAHRSLRAERTKLLATALEALDPAQSSVVIAALDSLEALADNVRQVTPALTGRLGGAGRAK